MPGTLVPEQRGLFLRPGEGNAKNAGHAEIAGLPQRSRNQLAGGALAGGAVGRHDLKGGGREVGFHEQVAGGLGLDLRLGGLDLLRRLAATGGAEDEHGREEEVKTVPDVHAGGARHLSSSARSPGNGYLAKYP